MSTFKILGRRLPFGGGGYFRLYPIWLTKFLTKQANKKSHPCIFYIHPYEVGSVIPKVEEISVYRKFRHYYNCGNRKKRIQKIVKELKFASMIEMLKEQGYFAD